MDHMKLKDANRMDNQGSLLRHKNRIAIVIAVKEFCLLLLASAACTSLIAQVKLKTIVEIKGTDTSGSFGFYANGVGDINTVAYDYMQSKTRVAYGIDTGSGKGSGITAANKAWDRFLIDAQPTELFVDAYPITADIPTTGMTDAQAADVGRTRFSLTRSVER